MQALWTASCIGGAILQIYHSRWLYQKILYPKWLLQWPVNIHLYVWKCPAPRSEGQCSLEIEAFYRFHNHDYDFAQFLIKSLDFPFFKAKFENLPILSVKKFTIAKNSNFIFGKNNVRRTRESLIIFTIAITFVP